MGSISPRSSDLQRRAFNRILLIKPSSLGDVIHALPVLHGLRHRYPDARIDWLIASTLTPLLKYHAELNELIPFDRKRYGRMWRSVNATGAFVRFVRALRTGRYDLALDLQGLFRTGFLAWASGAPVRIGFGAAREGASLFYTHRLRVDDPEMHAVDRNFRVAKLLGFETVPVRFTLEPSSWAREEAGRLLHEICVDDRTPVILVAPGARWDTKVWPAERFAATIDELHDRGRGHCVLVGGIDEAPLCRGIAQGCRSAPVNLAGKTSLDVLPAVIERADLVLCQDSAVMHLAVALGRPLVCLIGPTNPRRTGPYRRLEDVVQRRLDCAPCYLRKLSQCRHDHRCMTALDVGSVLTAVERAMERTTFVST